MPTHESTVAVVSCDWDERYLLVGILLCSCFFFLFGWATLDRDFLIGPSKRWRHQHAFFEFWGKPLGKFWNHSKALFNNITTKEEERSNNNLATVTVDKKASDCSQKLVCTIATEQKRLDSLEKIRSFIPSFQANFPKWPTRFVNLFQ